MIEAAVRADQREALFFLVKPEALESEHISQIFLFCYLMTHEYCSIEMANWSLAYRCEQMR